MDRTLNLFCGIFLTFGIVFSGIAIYFAADTLNFINRSATAKGVVVDLAGPPSLDTARSGTYHPIVKFTAGAAEQTFRSAIGIRGAVGSLPSYRIGESVDVLYDRANPADARIASLWSLWLVAMITGLLGAVFTAIGGGVFMARRITASRARDLRCHGHPVETDFQAVELNGRLKVNGRSPWRVVSQWLDPRSNALFVFRSENLWFDPTPYIRSKRVTVFVDPNNPRRYAMDVSFLPKLAN